MKCSLLWEVQLLALRWLILWLSETSHTELPPVIWWLTGVHISVNLMLLCLPSAAVTGMQGCMHTI